MSNSTGSYAISQKAIWRAFDALPQSVRERLARCPYDWVPTKFAKAWNGGKWSAPALIKIIDKWESDAIEEHYIRVNRQGVAGVDYHARLSKQARKKYAVERLK